MSGVKAIRKLLANNAGVTALIPATRIYSGASPQGALLPNIIINSIVSTTRNILKYGSKRHVRELVQVSISASTYDAVKPIILAVRKACGDQMPTVTGISGVVVLLESQGPDFIDTEASIYIQSQDFSVSYSEATS